MNRARSYVVIGLLIALVSACAPRVTSEVTRFHKNGRPGGETVAIVPLEETKIGSLEFRAYAELVADKLIAIGYRIVAEDADPALLARMDYSVGAAQTKIHRWPRSYVHYHFHYGRYHPYYFGHYWDEPYVYVDTVYPRAFDLSITRVSGERIFEGHVKSVGRSDTMNDVMPYLVEAMFHNFPGESGVTKVVTIDSEGAEWPY